jgi:TolB-like protein/class 3 adenylate cyclase/Flp pilus assembly protein TadD
LTGERVHRRLAAVLAADVAGYSRLMGADEEATLARLKTVRKTLVDPAIASHRGRIVKTTGDGMLVEFASAVDAARCAVEVQRTMAAPDPDTPLESRIAFRIGIHVGDIIIDDDDIFGDGVNIAARLEGIAEPGGICISDDAHRQIRGKVDIAFDDMGSQSLKNIAEPMRAWRAQPGSMAPSAPTRSSAEPNAPLALPDKPSIAVLPFQNMSGDQEQEYFADGMVEDIITGLSRSKSLFVIARNSTFTYKGKAVDIRQVGRELGVRYVLEGSVRKAGKRVRVTAQLIDTSTDAHIWADKFDSDLEDIFELQDRLTSTVIGAISPQLERAEMERAQRKPTENLQAYDYYLRALFSIHQQTRQGNLEALRLAKMATSLDPSFALAHSFAANTFGHRKAFGWTKDVADEQAEARQFADRAIQLDKDDPLVLAQSGQVYSYVLEEPGKGLALLTKALALDPNLTLARNWIGWTNIYLGNFDAALEQFSASLRLSPLDPRLFLPQTGMAYALFFAGRYEEGLSWANSAIQTQSNFPGGPRMLMANLAMIGRVEEARRACDACLKIEPSLRISGIARRTPFRRHQDVEKLAEAYRIAGVPE